MSQSGLHGRRHDETEEDLRRFRVRSRHEDVHHGRIVTEPTFEAAAIAYLEHQPLPEDGRTEIGVIVHDIQSGHEHSFLVRFPTGEACSGR